MSLQVILDTIHASGEDQVRAIEARAQAQVEEILAQARVEAQQLREESCSAVSAPAAAEHARILHQARLEALRIVGDAREALVDTALCQTREYLAGLRTDTTYPAALRRLTKEALTALNGSLQGNGNTRLEADPRDQELLDSVLPNLQLELPISYELHCWGGLTAESQDGRVVVINTLEARLERATPYLRRCLAALFENRTNDERRTTEKFQTGHPSLVFHPSSLQVT